MSNVKIKTDNELRDFIFSNNINSIKEYQNEIYEFIKEIKSQINKIEVSMETMKSYDVNYDEETMKDSLYDLQLKLDYCIKHNDSIIKLKYEKEDKCEHNYVYDWHDSHYDYYVCLNCGKTLKC